MFRVTCISIIFQFTFLTVIIADGKFCKTPDDKNGKCRQFYSCDAILEALDKIPKPLNSKLQDYLNSYNCGPGGNDFRVCCPAEPIYFDEYTDDNRFGLLTEPPNIYKHKNLHLLPQECANVSIKNDKYRIIGGTQAGLFGFPYMALLFYKEEDGSIDFQCGGTIINDRYILTAAHCIHDNIVKVRVGEYDLSTEIDCEKDVKGRERCAPPYQDLEIEETISHNKYNETTIFHDIALIRVSAINMSQENIKPVCLPLGDKNRNYNFMNKWAIAVGWGATDDEFESSVLLQVLIPYVPIEKCSTLYEKGDVKHDTPLNERQICAGRSKDKDSSFGDSGGPLLSFGPWKNTNRLVQQGITSFGYFPEDEDKYYPGVYTRVAYYMDWILDNMKP